MGGEKANEDHGWGLDPLWDSYVRLTVGTLKGLKAINPESPNILALPMGRAVEKVRVLGDIVSVKWKATSTMIEFHVDDGTGLLACIWWLNPGWGDKPYVKGESIKLGRLAQVGGKISHYKGEMQMTVTFLTIEKDHNAEALFWLETTALYRGPYTEPPPARKNHAERERKRARIAAPGPGGGAGATGGKSRENAFVDAARAFIGEKKTFLYAEYRDDPVIAATAEAEIRGADQSEKLSRDTVEFKAKQLIMRTLQMLRKEGSVYLKDESMDLYAILSIEGDIEPACLAAIQSGGKGCAVHYKDIVSIVRRDPKTSFVEVTAIDAALQGLEESSRIYQSGNFEYKVFES